MGNQFYDETEIRKAITILKSDCAKTHLFEIRIFGGRKSATVGYFKSIDRMLECLRRERLDGKNVYIVLNEINEGCYARTASDRFIQGEHSTSDNDITARHWVLIDIDPKRSSEISATNEQVALAKEKAGKVYNFLSQQGFTEPVIGFSGNGYHLLYRIKMSNTTENSKTIEDFLKTLDMLFSDDDIKIDTANKNAARICKLYGTLAQKGRNTDDRPHRMSKLLKAPAKIIPVDKAYIEKVINILPKEPDRPQRYNSYNGEQFDIRAWMNKYGIHYRESSWNGGTRYILDHCPFDESHKGKDAMIFQASNGAIGFHCFHDSCADKTWKDVRILFEPDAYEKKWQEQDRKMYGHYNRNKERARPESLKPTEGNPIWYTPMDIFNMPKEEVHYIKTGYDGIDKKLYGLKKKGISVLTGLRSAGKSTWLDGVILNAIQDGNTVGCYSGELDEKNFMRWLIRQAAGRNGVEPGRYEGQWNVPYKNIKAISEWLQGKFFLYNNHHGNNYPLIHEEIRKKIEKDKLDLVVIDNLMALDIDDLAYQKFDAQKNFVLNLKRLAIETDVHILFVAHPRKTVSFLRLEDISGSGDLANAVDNAFLIHRNNEDFKIRSKEMFKWKEDHLAYSGTNVIEVAKDRESGTQDWFIPLWYEVETKRMKNDIAENILYGWQGSDDFAPASDFAKVVFS